ncbi:MAG: hypothetical protein AAFV33_25545 [Chloroflexota bacterium]
MTEQPQLTGAVDMPEDVQPERVWTRREVMIRRFWFWVGIIAWIVTLLIPFFLVVLAMRGQVEVNLPGDVPENLRVWMVMEKDERGVAYSLPTVAERSDEELQVQTNVRYLLWEGENESLAYCSTYSRVEGDWQLAGVSEVACGETLPPVDDTDTGGS